MAAKEPVTSTPKPQPEKKPAPAKEQPKPLKEPQKRPEEKKAEVIVPVPVGKESSANVLLFGLWPCSGVKVTDLGLAQYMNLSSIHVPSTGRRNANKRFGKAKLHVVERLINKIMVTGHHSGSKKHVFTSGRNSGKKNLASRLVKEAFLIVEKKSKRNPVEVFVQAIQNGAPRAEITSVEMGGVRHPVAVDCSPQRRVDLALGALAKGAFKKSINSKTSVTETLAEEIVMAAANDPKSQLIDKKTVLEKQAEASK